MWCSGTFRINTTTLWRLSIDVGPHQTYKIWLLRACSERVEQPRHVCHATLVLLLGEFVARRDEPGGGGRGLPLSQVDVRPEESEARDDAHEPTRVRQRQRLPDTRPSTNREWKTKYWDEVQSKKTSVLPVLLADCDIPQFLKTKKFADFRRNYSAGFVEFVNSFTPLIQNRVGAEPLVDQGDSSARVSRLLAEVQSRRTALSQCIAEALQIARSLGDEEFETFCRNELAGWPTDNDAAQTERLRYRHVEFFASPFGEINNSYLGWGGDLTNALNYMRSEPKKFFPFTLVVGHAVSKLEADIPKYPSNSLATVQMKIGKLLKKCDHPEALVTAYGRSDSYTAILESVRGELTRYLLKLLPRGVLR